MRAGAALLVLVVAGGCSGVDNFGAFRFDGGSAGGDLASGDAAAPAFGDPCTANSCMQYGNTVQPTQCISMMSGTTFPGGICSRGCIIGSVACNEYPDAVCAPLNNNVNYCLPRCTGGGTPCRTGYDCCGGGNKVGSGQPGACAPSDSSLCH